MTWRERLRTSWDQAASAWCWVFGHPEAVVEVKDRGLVWTCPLCRRLRPSPAFPRRKAAGR